MDDNALSLHEIGRRIGHKCWWVETRIRYLNIQQTCKIRNANRYDVSIIEEILKVTDEEMKNCQHRPHSKESLLKQSDSYKKYYKEHSEEIKTKRKNTKIERYGENRLSEKQKNFLYNQKTLYSKFYENYKNLGWIPMRDLDKHYGSIENIITLYNLDELKVQDPFFKNRYVRFVKNKDIDFITNEINKNYQDYGTSKLEREILKFVESIFNGEIISNNRTILNGKELDIYIPSELPPP